MSRQTPFASQMAAKISPTTPSVSDRTYLTLMTPLGPESGRLESRRWEPNSNAVMSRTSFHLPRFQDWKSPLKLVSAELISPMGHKGQASTSSWRTRGAGPRSPGHARAWL